MTTAKSISDKIYLRYSGKGHIRFSLPEEICTDLAAAQIEEALLQKEGVYRVKVFKSNRKLSIRFDETATDLRDIALCLEETILEISKELLKGGSRATEKAPGKGEKVKAKLSSYLGNLKEKYNKVEKKKGTLPERIISTLKGPLVKNKSVEKNVIHLINDIVIFYLIKIHWNTITTRLMKHPLKYISQWLTLFYLIFLYVRHQKRGNNG